MTNIKRIIGSALVATAFAAASVGTTFALFTDEARTTIAIQSGKVDIESDVIITKVESLNENDTGNVVAEGGLHADWCNAGSADVITNDSGAQSLVIKEMTPGDKITFKVKVTNKSNVTTKWRLRLSKTDSVLANVLVDNLSGPEAGWQIATPVNTSVGEVLAEKEITISFPNTDNLITPREEGVDNQYQGLTAAYTLYAEAVQGNAKVDNRIVVSSYAKDGEHDGGTILYNPVNGETTFAVHQSQIADGVLEGINLRYAEDSQGNLVTDDFGYATILPAGGCDFKAEIGAAANQHVYLPYGTINEADINGSGITNSNEHLRFLVANQNNFTLHGATRKENNAYVNATTIDFKGLTYHSGLTFSQMMFVGTATNQLVAAMKNIDFISSESSADYYNLDYGNCHSQTMFFAQYANVQLYNCSVNAETFQKNAVTRCVFDLRHNAQFTLNNCDVVTYAFGANWPNVGICAQTLVSAFTDLDNKHSSFGMYGGSIEFATAAQNRDYSSLLNQEAGTVELGALSQVAAYQNKLVAFYQSNASAALDVDQSSYTFNGVTFPDSFVAGDPAVTAVAAYSSLIHII